MLVAVDTDYIDLVHNTEVLEAALDELPAGWIVDVEFFRRCIRVMVIHHKKLPPLSYPSLLRMTTKIGVWLYDD